MNSSEKEITKKELSETNEKSSTEINSTETTGSLEPDAPQETSPTNKPPQNQQNHNAICDDQEENLLEDKSVLRELDDIRDKYLRTLAEMDNLRKRNAKERSEILKYQGEKILADLLEVVDNLELALKHAEADPESLREGVKMIHKLFVDTLAKWEVVCESAIGAKLDPSKHEALGKVPKEGVASGTILEEHKKYYRYKDKALRIGQVLVAE
ncbi:MAG TPA: nucleotide exchange factor GrpE [Oligoflexia bacterium]|nr:nucleotide exchange factor GrpE [Oligoflexia bacterium]HMP26717.1 nucleotide exchange factor GrpE [Oligoflexia bacterium]